MVPSCGVLNEVNVVAKQSHCILFLQKTNRDVGICMDSSLEMYLRGINQVSQGSYEERFLIVFFVFGLSSHL